MSPVHLDANRIAAALAGIGLGETNAIGAGIDADARAVSAPEEPLDVMPLGHGQSNLTYLVKTPDGTQAVLRRPPLGQLLNSAHDVLREARILGALERTPVPVPRILRSAGAGELGDVPVVLMEYVAGAVIDTQEAAEALETCVRGELGREVARVLAAVHAVDVRDVELAELASHSPYAERQLRRWSAQWEASRTRDLPSLQRLTALLRGSVPPPRRLCLVHGDFHLRNLVVDETSGRIRAVLDWELATLGEPLADLGTVLAYWTEADDPDTGLFTATSLPGFPDRDGVVETYLATSGEIGVDERELGFWHALGLWKVAIIAEGILRRTLEEPSNARAGAPTPRTVTALVDRAWSVAVAAGLT